jgi:hypothetical protein
VLPGEVVVELGVGGLDGQLATAGHGVTGVHRQVHQDELELAAVSLDGPGVRRGDGDQIDVLTDEPA